MMQGNEEVLFINFLQLMNLSPNKVDLKNPFLFSNLKEMI